MIVFNTSMLDRALAQYTRYEPTASEYLRETREKWIPIKVEDASKPRICKIASDILEGGVYDSYEAILSEEYKIAICLTLFQAYAEYMANLMLSGVSTETLYTLWVSDSWVYFQSTTRHSPSGMQDLASTVRSR